jgi:uncharacterized delta-60 repeat protein
VLRLRADGSPDPAFGGGDGIQELDLDGSGAGYAWARAGRSPSTAAGRVVVAGTWSAGGRDVAAVARLRPDGALDETLGGTGRLLVEFSAAYETIGAAIAVAAGDAIVLAGHDRGGTMPWTLGAARITEGGELDTSFSGDGRVSVPVGTPEQAGGVAVDALGRVVIASAGTSSSGPENRGVPDDEATVVRLTQAGTPDPAFSGDGIARFTVPGAPAGAAPALVDVAADAQGRVVATGSTELDSSSPKGIVARLSSDGALDPSFAGDGIDVVGSGAGSAAAFAGLALQGDGAVVVAGLSVREDADSPRATAVRIGPDGTRDATFGPDGVRRFGYRDTAGTQDMVGDVTVDTRGGLVIAGAQYEPRARGTRGDIPGAVARLVGRGDAAQPGGAGDGGGDGGGGGTAAAPGTVQPAPGVGPRALPGPARPATAPKATIDRIRGRSPRRFSGRTTGAVRRVEVAVVRKGAKRARWVRAKGTARWSLTLKRRLARGRYELRVRVAGADGKAGTPTSRGFRVR